MNDAAPPPGARRARSGSAGVLGRTMRYAGGFITHPRRAADAIASDPQGLWVGLVLGILFLGAYALTVLIYHLLGHQPVAQPFLRIPPERWYLVQTFTTLPVGMAAFFTYAGVAYSICRAWGARVLPWPDWVESLRIFVLPIAWWKRLGAVIAATIPFAGIMAVFIR